MCIFKADLVAIMIYCTLQKNKDVKTNAIKMQCFIKRHTI